MAGHDAGRTARHAPGPSLDSGSVGRPERRRGADAAPLRGKQPVRAEPGEPGKRLHVDAGELWVCVTDVTHHYQLIPNVFSFLRQKDTAEGFLREMTTHELRVRPHGSQQQIEVAADGEVFQLTFPLVYRVLP